MKCNTCHTPYMRTVQPKVNTHIPGGIRGACVLKAFQGLSHNCNFKHKATHINTDTPIIEYFDITWTTKNVTQTWIDWNSSFSYSNASQMYMNIEQILWREFNLRFRHVIFHKWIVRHEFLPRSCECIRLRNVQVSYNNDLSLQTTICVFYNFCVDLRDINCNCFRSRVSSRHIFSNYTTAVRWMKTCQQFYSAFSFQ